MVTLARHTLPGLPGFSSRRKDATSIRARYKEETFNPLPTQESKTIAKTRYRKPRFLNRTLPQGWLAPSLLSRVFNIETWVEKLCCFAPVKAISQELVRFDMQQMENPEISGKEYQQGTLAGYETKQYLLEKWNRTCVYCGAQNVPLEIEHIIPKSKGGSNRVSNLTLACVSCNQK
ncbi:MAG: hypothetical protein COB67_08445, partial [SAR324 cluster bacterium]